MLQRIPFIGAFIAALSGVLGKHGAPAIEDIMPLDSYPNREARRRMRYGNRSRIPGKAQPAGSKAVRIANV